MSMSGDEQVEAEMAVLERISSDDRARRELLWLRALEKGDLDAALDLERLDPALRSRMLEAGVDPEEREDETPRARRDRFVRHWHECYERHARAMASPGRPTPAGSVRKTRHR